ncbi:Galactokinase [Grifola frondosa]|uniref:Galactokinase n=1 Tax=Grifola frondosa TaxID=5627 RepID=A0A1C7LNW8_GRIFR|nr:Galactokinase [Grifola frondosa]
MAAQLPIPVYTALSEAFPDLATAAEQAVRFNDVAQEFERRFGHKPTYIARAPGRVNLIGEHIDYVLFGVFPAAIERDILIACAPSASQAQTPALSLGG